MGQEAWNDGVTSRAPTSFATSLSVATVLDNDTAVFGDLQVGLPLFKLKQNAGVVFSLGMIAQIRPTGVFTADKRSIFRLRNGGPDLWFMLFHPRSGSTHSLVTRFRYRLEPLTNWYQLTPTERGWELSIGYNGYIPVSWFDISIDARMGLVEYSIVEWLGTLVFIVPIGERFAMGVGGTAGYPGLLTPMATARVRPFDQLEVGVGVGLPIQVFRRGIVGFSEPSEPRVGLPYPMVELKYYAPGNG